jgi:hypothetical protein
MGYRLDGWGSIPGRGKRFFSSPQRPEKFWGPSSLISNGYRWVVFARVKRSERESDHSPPSSAEVKNSGAIPIRLHDAMFN